MVVGYFSLTSLAYGIGRDPNQSRYTFAGALFAFILLAELLQGRRLKAPPIAMLGLAAALVLSLYGNLVNLGYGGERLRYLAEIDRGQLAGLELSRPTLEREAPERLLETIPSKTPNLIYPAALYFAAADSHGTPGYDPAEITTRSEVARESADHLLARQLRLDEAPAAASQRARGAAPPLAERADGEVRTAGSCITFDPRPLGAELGSNPYDPGDSPQVELVIPGEGITLRTGAGPPAQVALRRFADAFAFAVAPVPARQIVRLRIPPDGRPEPWRASITTEASVRACGIAG